MKYKTGHITPFWDSDYKNFSYERQPLMGSEIQEWHDMGFYQPFVKSFSGCMYTNKYPMPDWVKKLDNFFGLKNQTYTFYRMSTFEIMPPHKDHYNTYIKLFNADPKRIYRIVLMLEDWKPGHYLEIDGQGFVNWQAGDYFMWENYCPHAAANIGADDRYTLQITGELIQAEPLENPEKTIFFSLHPMNFKNLENSKLITSTFPVASQMLKENPGFVYLGNSTIEELANINLTTDDVSLIKQKGIHFILYEPVCSHISGKKHNQSFFSEYTYETSPSLIRVDEFDSIYNFSKKYNINPKKVFVHCCESDLKKSFPFYVDKMTLLSDDLFIKTYPKFNNINDNYNFLFSKNFICTTWRYSKHRHLITAYLSNLNSLYNWYYKCDYTVISDNPWFDLEKIGESHPMVHKKILNGIESLNANSPIILDVQAVSAIEVVNPKAPYYPNTLSFKKYETPSISNPTNLLLEKFYNSCFCSVVCETRYAQHAPNFSEKVYQAIQYKRPFIVVAPPKTLEYIKSMGFKTFDGFFDESYDKEFNHEKRLLKIFELLEWINFKKYDEIVSLYKKMQPIIEYNFKHLISIMEK